MIIILTPPFLTLAKKTFIISEPVVHSHKFVIGNGKSVAWQHFICARIVKMHHILAQQSFEGIFIFVGSKFSKKYFQVLFFTPVFLYVLSFRKKHVHVLLIYLAHINQNIPLNIYWAKKWCDHTLSLVSWHDKS